MNLAQATVFLWVLGSLQAFEIVEKENIFQRTPCPAFLMFDNAAYLADMSFELPCHCKPEEVSAVVWYYQKHLGSGHTKVLADFDGRVLTEAAQVRAGSDMLVRFSIRMFSLLVFRAQPEDSGLYFCGTREGDYFYAYDVDIQSSEGMVATFKDQGQEPFADEYHGSLHVFTTFWEWTPCDRCGVRGEQWRIGLCYLQSPDLSPRYRKTSPDVVSCGSRAVPRQLRAKASDHAPELLLRSCLVPCEEKKKIQEGAMALFSYVSKVGSRPWLPQVPIQFHQQRLGRGLIISCPGARPEHAVAWDKDHQYLYRTQYLKGVNRSMRVFIDHGNHLHIRFTQLGDRGIYYCWRQGVRIAGFRLAVTSRGRYPVSFSSPEIRATLALTLIGYLLITAVFIAIHLCRCCCYLFRCCPHCSP
ncbi:Ig-like V-type domain-containing protein FAM187A [Physeter macrocephalus]|uniref:Ig-like V-type domain-containing protein FAM187A n=1 Tax=Physeter macrocephalus TaxID=9755 RepID=A0A2Y9FLK3_PHYMC|nr:Ig-like V-type domain-containing protein FAM187A [Physeter catodon]|eukprot:XP_007125488.1 Ig-like V-type domain-containing protein FAM187A [Physeter catodon]